MKTSRPAYSGMTAIELLLVIAIASILATIALPHFNTLIETHQARQLQWRWTGLLKSARQQAISRQQWVTVCPVLGNECVTDLNQPWHAFFDDDNDHKYTDPADVFAVMSVPEKALLVMYSGVAILPYFRYRASGLSGNLRSLSVCPTGQLDSLAFHMSSTHLGRIRFFKDTDGDGIVDRQYQGKQQNIVCA
jgi:type IV fimbrial biogenesis protein FimT